MSDPTAERSEKVHLALRAAEDWQMYFHSEAADFMAIAISGLVRDLEVEWERCAKVAEQYDAPETGGLYCGCPEDIAAEIRKGE